jgi:hypothetical protein
MPESFPTPDPSPRRGPRSIAELNAGTFILAASYSLIVPLALGELLVLAAGLGILGIGLTLWLLERQNPALLDRRWVYGVRRWGGAASVGVILGVGAVSYGLLGTYAVAIFLTVAAAVAVAGWLRIFANRP